MVCDDIKIESSPLGQVLQRDGVEIEILIYRIEGVDDDWTLEVVDAGNNSTVWDDPFETDQLALNEVMQTIEEEGISALLRPSDDLLH
jgi:uncharacterized protein